MREREREREREGGGGKREGERDVIFSWCISTPTNFD